MSVEIAYIKYYKILPKSRDTCKGDNIMTTRVYPGMQIWFNVQKLTNVVHPINRIKGGKCHLNRGQKASTKL